MGTLGSRLAACRAESGYTQKEVCTRTGIKQGTLSELENDKYPTSSFIPHLAELYGVEALWLAEGRGRKTRGESLQSVPPGDNRLPIRRALFKLSAGVSGYEVEYENGQSEPIYMGKRWFDQHNFRADKLLAVKVIGRSMEPSLYDGDLVVINTEDTALKDGAVFAANYEGELVIKRLRRDGGQWYLSSDNQDKVRFSDKICSEGCGLIGRIVYKQSEYI